MKLSHLNLLFLVVVVSANAKRHLRSSSRLLQDANTTTLQAEDAVLFGPQVVSGRGSQGNAFVDFINAAEDSVTWQYDAAQSGAALVQVRYSLGWWAEPRSMELDINGIASSVTFGITGDSNIWANLDVEVFLQQGINTIQLLATGDSGPDIDSLIVTEESIDPHTTTPALDYSVVIQAERAELQGVNTIRGRNAEDDFYVDPQNANGDSITWTVYADRSGRSELEFVFAINHGTRAMALEINGIRLSNPVEFSGASWYTWIPKRVLVVLKTGRNSIKLIATGDSGPNFDYLKVIGAKGDGPGWGAILDGEGVLEPNESSVPVDTYFSLDVKIAGNNQGIDENTVNPTTVKVLNLSQGGAEQETVINTTGGGDSISISLVYPMAANNSFRLIVDGVKALTGASYPTVTTNFQTGSSSIQQGADSGFDFVRTTVSEGIPITSLVFSGDYSKLYAATLDGEVVRWDVQADGKLSGQQRLSVGSGRALIGIAIDPTNPNRLWVSNNESLGITSSGSPGLFTGKISYIDISDEAAFTGTPTDYIVGLPRSSRDHLVNAAAFGPDGALYVTIGSNSAMGAPDGAWGNRPETLLSAAVLRIDTTRALPSGGFNVQTDGSNAYDPFSSNAPLTIFATGLRNTYDLLFHSNGSLYAANNGSAAGGNSPDDPRTPVNEFVGGGSTQQDFLYNVVEQGYYGHPNPSRGEYIREGGNPTSGNDLVEVPQYPVGVQPETNYKGFAYDFGQKRSPNGMTEYTSDAFGGALKGSILVVEFSAGDRIVGLKTDSNGAIVANFVLATGFSNPLDVAVHKPSGNVYVTNYGSSGRSDDSLILLQVSASGQNN